MFEVQQENIVSSESIRNFIYVVRGEPVMMDSDLAILYQVETKRLNEAVKRNLARFPNEFRFRLTEEEYILLRSQFATSIKYVDGKEDKGGRRYLPYVFTEQGIAMLSAVLRSEVAIQVSIKIIKEFVGMRKFFVSNVLLLEHLNEIKMKQLEYEKETVSVCIYTDSRTKLTEKDIGNFNKQYPILEIKYTGIFHDRFLFLDESKAYHIGASLKDAGKKCFAISLFRRPCNYEKRSEADGVSPCFILKHTL